MNGDLNDVAAVLQAPAQARAPIQAPAQTRAPIGSDVEATVQQALREAEQALQQAQQGVDAARSAQGGAPTAGVGIPGPPGPPPFPYRRGGRPQQIGTATGQPFMPFSDVPERAQEVAFAFLFTIAAIFIGTPLARAFARRMDRRPVAAAAAAPEVVSRLDRIEQAVEAVALEVERISEGQRYVTKLMSEPRALPSPNEAAAHELRMMERGAAERAAVDQNR